MGMQMAGGIEFIAGERIVAQDAKFAVDQPSGQQGGKFRADADAVMAAGFRFHGRSAQRDHAMGGQDAIQQQVAQQDDVGARKGPDRIARSNRVEMVNVHAGIAGGMRTPEIADLDVFRADDRGMGIRRVRV